MPASETIVAAASPPGRSSRALVRASGPAAPDLASMLFPQPEARSPTVCRWKLGRHACPVIATLSRAPATFTGDDTLELVLPGNPFLVERVLDQWCAHEGVRRAGPGEFSARAYLNGRIALDEAEGVAAVISARTAEDLAAASRLARGQTGDAYRAWAEELTTLLALVEAGIDFTDQEDVVPITPDRLVARLQVLRSEMLARAGGELAVQAADDLPLVVLAGPPNAGKSTLFNALLGRPRAIVADEAGTTRDVLVETLALDEAAGPGLAVRLADLPGLDAAESSPAGQAGQSGAREALARADAVILCDPAGRFEQATRSNAPTLRVRTKADLPGRAGGDVEVCALDGWRMEVLRRGIADVAVRSPNASCAVALARHARNIRIATGALQEAAAGIDPGAHALAAPELIAHGLRRALDELEQVLGRVSPDDVIGRIFATFCVGK